MLSLLLYSGYERVYAGKVVLRTLYHPESLWTVKITITARRRTGLSELANTGEMFPSSVNVRVESC